MFRGHPALIQGFKTFLPPGYRIECTIDQSSGAGGAGAGGEKGVTTITVTTPMGMTTRTQVTDPNLEPSTSASTSTAPASTSSVKQESAPQAPIHSLPPPANTSANAAPSTPSVLANQSAPAPLSSAPPTPSQATTPGGGAVDARPPMEFNHAINYVNKIKNRFLKEPDTYKAFLEILQTYQKEGKAIQEVSSTSSHRSQGSHSSLF